MIERDTPALNPGEVLIKVEAAAINPSDIRNVEGFFHTALPRIPGRDYAGIAAAGAALLGQEVWGSGPGFGILRDGAHAGYTVAALIGIGSVKLTGPEIASIMDSLRPGFEAGALKPFDVTPWPLAQGVTAYEKSSYDGAAAKHVLLPRG